LHDERANTIVIRLISCSLLELQLREAFVDESTTQMV